MPPLRYKFIGSEQHLSFDSIRRLVLHQLSIQDRRRAWKHIEQCTRCGSIHESLAKPQLVVRRRSSKSHGAMLALGIVVVIGLSLTYVNFGTNIKLSKEDVSIVYSWGLIKIQNKALPKQTPQPPEVAPSEYFKKSASNILLKSIYPSSKPVQKSHPIQSNQIHGLITANNQPLQGVTVMVPDGKTARVSNADGRYFIQVPDSTTVLVFIYQGKQLVKELDVIPGRMDINLIPENMEYAEIESALSNEELITSN